MENLGLRKLTSEILIYNEQTVISPGSLGLFNVEGFYNLRVNATTTNSSGTTPTLDIDISTYNHDLLELIKIGAITQINGNIAQSNLIDVRAVRHIRLDMLFGGTNPSFDLSLSLVLG